MTVLNMDLAIQSRCAILSVDVNSIYLATQPAITSDDQNAALIYEKVFAKLKEFPSTDVKNPPIGEAEKFDPAEPETIAYLAHHRLHDRACCIERRRCPDVDLMRRLPTRKSIK